ncbi:hypothetical protein DFH06DRAFT_1146244 [Mycena polygramma]|nr:hypothetical protein DFH06DRAFT_1146244 [Mycena polygramma]
MPKPERGDDEPQSAAGQPFPAAPPCAARGAWLAAQRAGADTHRDVKSKAAPAPWHAATAAPFSPPGLDAFPAPPDTNAAAGTSSDPTAYVPLAEASSSGARDTVKLGTKTARGGKGMHSSLFIYSGADDRRRSQAHSGTGGGRRARDTTLCNDDNGDGDGGSCWRRKKRVKPPVTLTPSVVGRMLPFCHPAWQNGWQNGSIE